MVPYAVALSDLVEVVWAATLAGIAVTAIFSTVVYTAARTSEFRRAGKRAASGLMLFLTVLGSLAFAALVVAGLRIMAS